MCTCLATRGEITVPSFPFFFLNFLRNQTESMIQNRNTKMKGGKDKNFTQLESEGLRGLFRMAKSVRRSAHVDHWSRYPAQNHPRKLYTESKALGYSNLAAKNSEEKVEF